ncbi:MAG TPA: M20/M25/M40 family metallo-hydrolase [Candidatus Binatia bacterium]|jgi:acetylornithine deacetylase/succinyl-diaminopimelate desuccinylase-like protein
MATNLSGETTELLQQLIRNACVNDGTVDSGGETRNADLLQTYLGRAGLDVQRFEARPGRASLVARIEGSDPTAPRLCLMAHTDVVPVNPQGWSRDPFGGELVEGEVWGRGAIDMLNLTSSMAVAFRHLAQSGFRPKGTLVYFGVADEEAGGVWGAEWMVDRHWDAVASDYVLTEAGGWSFLGHDGTRRVVVNVGEKGIAWRRLRVKGTPSHGSMPFGADNALVKAAEVVRRIAAYRPAAHLDELWRAQVEVLPLSDEQKAGLLDPRRVWDTIAQLPPPMARRCHAATHTSFSPNVVHGGQKTNIIPDTVDVEVDIRTMPGTSAADVDAFLAEALGDLAPHVEVSPLQQNDATASPVASPLWQVLTASVRTAYPEAQLLPSLIVGGTDARFFRAKGATAYGAGLFSPSMTFESFGSRFHGNDERVDVASLGLATDLWVRVARELLA